MTPDDTGPGLFEVMYNTRSMRRLKPDPLPEELVWKVLEAGTQAPSGQNTQPWAFLVVRDRDAKQFIAKRYFGVMNDRLAASMPSPDDQSPRARSVRASWHLAEHLGEAPVLLLVCGRRDWPFAVPEESRKGLAPPSYGSVLPCVQNILLACRALGLGATLTTLHQLFESDLHERFDIPDDYGVVAMIPIGYPRGKFGPVRRASASELTHFDRWDQGDI